MGGCVTDGAAAEGTAAGAGAAAGKLSVVCFASGAFSVPLVEALAAAPWVDLRAVVVNPDRCAGRGNELRACPAKTAALAAGAPVRECPDVENAKFVEAMAALSPDVFVVVDFGQFLPPELLAVPRMGSVNLHPSLLPRWRGASPLQWTLAAGDETTGVTVLYVTEGMDSGDILSQETAPVEPDDTAETLGARLSRQGARQMMEVLDAMRRGETPEARPQDHSQATRARLLKRRHAAVDWTCPATEIRNRWRGFSPWPGSLAALPDGTPLKLLSMRVAEGRADAAPGEVLGCDGDALLVACGGGTALALDSVQPAGKGAMSGAALVCGRRVAVGGRLGNGVVAEKTKK